jgi:hypothetical protein
MSPQFASSSYFHSSFSHACIVTFGSAEGLSSAIESGGSCSFGPHVQPDHLFYSLEARISDLEPMSFVRRVLTLNDVNTTLHRK